MTIGQLELDHLRPFGLGSPLHHQGVSQAKINRYLAFVESGEVLERYPDARTRPVRLCGSASEPLILDCHFG